MNIGEAAIEFDIKELDVNAVSPIEEPPTVKEITNA